MVRYPACGDGNDTLIGGTGGDHFGTTAMMLMAVVETMADGGAGNDHPTGSAAILQGARQRYDRAARSDHRGRW
jgi:hypothetical protein